MMLRAFVSICFICLTVSVLVVTSASAYRLAVMPIHDLTASRSGLDVTLTKQLSDVFQQQGLDVIPYHKMLTFLVDNSIRRSGEIDSLTVRRLAQQLNSDGVLLTTITERTTQHQPKIAMTLVLVDGQSGEQVWGATVCDHINDSQPLLGIGRLENDDDLKHHSFALHRGHAQCQNSRHAATRSIIAPTTGLPISTLNRHCVRNGNPVFCRVQIKFLNQSPTYLEMETSAGSTILRKSRIPNCYEGQVATSLRNGSHPVHLKIHWSKDKARYRGHPDSLSCGQYARHR